MQRLSKVLAMRSVASRRMCEQIIMQGRVFVKGSKILIPQHQVEEDEADIVVDGKKVPMANIHQYYVLNKPIGYVCSTVSKSKKVLDLFNNTQGRLFTVGRLDKDTNGLIIVTNDGHFANRVMHPSFGVIKEYLVKTQAEITDRHLKEMMKGTMIEDVLVKPVKVTKVRRCTFKIAVRDGKKHEVRLISGSVGLEVLELTRIRIGGLLLGTLPVGQYRHMSEAELEQVFEGANSKKVEHEET